ncbi:hypothetical protein L1049_024442 [Liquidambar formosana]|uniref:Uncharacterized protein n=1 Tax=Liquidambar formosana TaxID=63359 RepID=A0AAP0RVT6_LIQFO
MEFTPDKWLYPVVKARPLSPVEVQLLGTSNSYETSLRAIEVQELRAPNSYEMSVRTLAGMLPKGVPIPPSGPSPEVN